MPKKRASSKAAQKSKMKVDHFTTNAKRDYPITKWETEGRVRYEKLKGVSKSKLSKYESYLVEHHFPQQQKQVAAECAQRRKEDRQRRRDNAGLVSAEYARPAAKVLIFQVLSFIYLLR